MTSLKRLIGVGVLVATVTAGAIGFSASANTETAAPPASESTAVPPVLSVLTGPVADDAPSLPGRPEIRPETMRSVLKGPSGVNVWAAKTVDDKVCIITNNGFGSGSSCNPPEVFNTFGALPLVRQISADTMLVSLLIDDRYVSYQAPGRGPQQVSANGVQFTLPVGSRGVVTLSGPGGARSIDLTPLL